MFLEAEMLQLRMPPSRAIQHQSVKLVNAMFRFRCHHWKTPRLVLNMNEQTLSSQVQPTKVNQRQTLMLEWKPLSSLSACLWNKVHIVALASVGSPFSSFNQRGGRTWGHFCAVCISVTSPDRRCSQQTLRPCLHLALPCVSEHLWLEFTSPHYVQINMCIISASKNQTSCCF